MRRRKYFIVLICLCFLFPKKSNSQNLSSSEDASKSIRYIYIYYLENIFDKNERYEKVRDSVHKYCTTSFIEKVRKGKASNHNTDMLMHVQDLPSEWKDNFRVTCILPNKKYRICIVDTRCVDVVVKRVNGLYKIDDVLSTDAVN